MTGGTDRGIDIGSMVGGYRIEAQIGRGGMGVVYRAEQPALGRQVAIKVIAPELASDEGFRKRFERESRIAASIEHPNAIPIYEAGEEDGVLFLVMRYVHGVDLRALIVSQERLGPPRAARIIEQVCGALDEAHARGLVHRDVKPGNIVIASQRGRDHAYLTDFGLTKRLSSKSGLTVTGQWVGTIDYAAPEQIEGKQVDARADVYALGCVLFEALTGKVPFEKEADMAKLFAHVNEPPPSASALVPGLPEQIDRVLERAMAKQRGDRFPSAGDLGRAIVAASEGHTVAAPERTVAAGAAAPIDSDPSATVHAAPETPEIPETVRADAAATVEAAPTAPEEVATPPAPTAVPAERPGPPTEPTRPLPAREPSRSPRRRILVGLGGLLAAAIAAGALVVATGGDDGGGGGDGSEGDPIGDVQTISPGGAYSLDVPADWAIALEESTAGTAVRTDVTSPSGDSRLSILRTIGDNRSAEELAREAQARGEATAEGYSLIDSDFDLEVGGSPGARLEFEKIDQFGLGPVLSVGYFLTAGGDGFRLQSNVKIDSEEAEQADAVARHAAETLTPL